MEKEHFIPWIAQVTDNQTTRIRLYPEQDTTVRFKYIKGAQPRCLVLWLRWRLVDE